MICGKNNIINIVLCIKNEWRENHSFFIHLITLLAIKPCVVLY